MVSPVTLRGMGRAEMEKLLSGLLADLWESAPSDCAGAMVVLWDTKGSFNYQGSIPANVKGGEQIRQIADAIDRARGIHGN